MSYHAAVAPLSGPTQVRNVRRLIPPFDFVKDKHRTNVLQNARRALADNAESSNWDEVVAISRRILENLLIDLLTYIEPAQKSRIRRKPLQDLVGDFSRIVAPQSAGQARLVQVLGNVAVHGSGGRLIWSEERAYRVLDMTAVLVHLIRGCYATASGQNLITAVAGQAKPTHTTDSQIAENISADAGSFRAYYDLIKPDHNRLRRIVLDPKVVQAMRRDIGVINTLTLAHWLSLLGKFDSTCFRRFVTNECKEIGAAFLATDGMRDVGMLLQALRKAEKGHTLSTQEYTNVLDELVGDPDRFVIKACLSSWRTTQPIANQLRRASPRAQSLAARLTSLLAMSPTVLRQLIDKRQFVTAKLLLRDWKRDRQIHNLVLGKTRRKGGAVFEEVVQALAGKVAQNQISLRELTDIVAAFPFRLRLEFLNTVSSRSLLSLIEDSGTKHLADFARLWSGKSRFSDGAFISQRLYPILTAKLGSEDIPVLSRTVWDFRNCNDPDLQLNVLQSIMTLAEKRDPLERSGAFVMLVWDACQIRCEVQVTALAALKSRLEQWLASPGIEPEIAVAAAGCLRHFGWNVNGERLEKVAESASVQQFLRVAPRNIWEALLLARGLTFLKPMVTHAPWFPTDRLLSELNGVTPENDVSRQLVSEMRKALIRHAAG